MATLALRGVPLPAAPLITEADVESAAFAYSQAAFEKARGAGTPLLPVPASSSDAGPAPYVRAVLTDMLARHAAGEDPRPAGETELAVAAEAHLALIEAVAAEAAQYNPVPPPVPLLPATPVAARYAAVESGDPEWLTDTVLRSLVRMESVRPPRSTAPSTSANTAPVLRLATESSYWRGVPVHGTRDKIQSEGRAAAMAAAVGAPKMDVAASPTSARELVTPSDPWLADEVARMSGAVIAGRDSGITAPSEDELRLAVLRKMAENNATEETSSRAAVIDAESVLGFLTNFDVMRDYGFQSV